MVLVKITCLLGAANGTVHVGLHESGTLDDSVCVVQKFVKCGTRTPHTLQLQRILLLSERGRATHEI